MTLTQWLLLPAFVQVALTISLAVRIGRGRVRAIRARKVNPAIVASDNSKWPTELRAVTNNYQNQFELPVLFYAALALIVAASLADATSVVLAWAFVALRLVHSFIHTGSNHLQHRFFAFLSGGIVIIALWLWLGLRLYVIG